MLNMSVSICERALGQHVMLDMSVSMCESVRPTYHAKYEC